MEMLVKCPTVRALMAKEERLFKMLQSTKYMPEAQFKELEAEWDILLAKVRCFYKGELPDAVSYD